MIIENVFSGSVVYVDSIQETVSIFVESISGRIGDKGDTGPAGPSGATGPQGPPGSAGRTALSGVVTATNANLVAAPSVGIYIPSGVFTANRNVDLSALNTDGDYWELYNFETTYSVIPTGLALYLSDGTALSVFPAQTNIQVRMIGGVLRVIN